MNYRVFLFTLLTVCTAHASAQVYKCIDEKGKSIYSDTPCLRHGSQALTDIQSSPASSSTAESPLSRQLDAAVRRAISEGDFSHAQSLALTPKHWEWIAAAKKDRQQQPVLGRTEADLSAEKGDSIACHKAKRDYEFEAGAYKQVQNAIDAKRSMMHAACGIKEPTQIKVDNTTVINRTIINQRAR